MDGKQDVGQDQNAKLSWCIGVREGRRERGAREKLHLKKRKDINTEWRLTTTAGKDLDQTLAAGLPVLDSCHLRVMLYTGSYEWGRKQKSRGNPSLLTMFCLREIPLSTGGR